MAELKIVLNDPKTGKSYQKVLDENQRKALHGQRLSSKVKGDKIGFSGYEFEITGGSDSSGFPMRWDVEGSMRKKILAVSGVGVKKLGKGVKQRKSVAGNQVYEKTAQLNLKIIKYGKDPLGESSEPSSSEEPSEKEDKKPEDKKDSKEDKAKDKSHKEEKKEETENSNKEENKKEDSDDGESDKEDKKKGKEDASSSENKEPDKKKD